jgi:hypothetical protein
MLVFIAPCRVQQRYRRQQVKRKPFPPIGGRVRHKHKHSAMQKKKRKVPKENKETRRKRTIHDEPGTNLSQLGPAFLLLWVSLTHAHVYSIVHRNRCRETGRHAYVLLTQWANHAHPAEVKRSDGPETYSLTKFVEGIRNIVLPKA